MATRRYDDLTLDVIVDAPTCHGQYGYKAHMRP